MINIDDKKGKGTHWVLLVIDRSLAVHFAFFGIEYIPQEVVHKIRDKSITHNIFRTQDNEAIIYGFYSIAFIEYMLAGKILLDHTSLFSLNDYEKNRKVVYKYFKDTYGRRSKYRV